MTRVTIGQLRICDDRVANQAAVRGVIEEAGRVGADLAVLPEYSSAYDRRGVGPDLAEPLSGPFVHGVRRAARASGCWVVFGTIVPGPDDEHAVNAVVVVDARGEVVGTYRKVHLYDAFGVRESDHLAAGPADAEPLVFEVGGMTWGVITCYDLRFPESARRVVDSGADAIVVPAAWAAGPLKADQWRTLAQARAIENTAVVVAVGQAGPGVTGRSLVVDADGRVGLEFDEAPKVRTVDIDPASVAAVRSANPCLVNRRYVVVPR